MSRGRQRRSDGEIASVSLLPFLAVLICTMGALIVLLVVTVQQAGNATTGSSEPIVSIVEPIVLESEEADPLQLEQSASELAQLQRAKEDLEWRADGLVASRESMLKAMQEQQLQLSMVEDQSLALQQRLERLQNEVVTLQSAALDQDQTSKNEARLNVLQTEIDQASKDLELAKQSAEDRNRRFTIIPHAGENGTSRRPLYVECTPDKVILQPEGIVLETSDFRTPMGPENPLASAMRAKREFLLNAGVVNSAANPYPLLIVRPGAERAYAACRAALTGWDEEFGYELVPAEMALAFPPADEMLVGFMNQIIDQVRARRALAMIVSDEKPSNGVVMGISHEQGGFVPDGGGSGASRIEAGVENGVENGAAESQGDFTAPMAGSSSSATSGANSDRSGGSAEGQQNQGVEPGRGGAFPAAASGKRSKESADNVQVGNYELKNKDGSSATKSQVEFAGGTAPSAANGSSGAKRTPTHAGGASGANGVTSERGGAAQMSFSMAETQGQNWALPNDTAGAIGVVRPVYLTCTANEIILHPESRTNQRQQQVPFAVTTTSAVQPFVGVLWERMEAWGVAGNGMYWQPLLKCEVGPGGEERFHELSALLHGSGLEITRR